MHADNRAGSSRARARAGSRYPFLTQKERDVETGLDYFLARYYSSIQGRFTSPDEFTGGPDELYTFVDDASDNPTFYADLRQPQSLNKYQYAFGNPLRYVDPDGHDPCCQQQDDTQRRVATGAAAGAAVGAVVGGIIGGVPAGTGGAAAGTLVAPGVGTVGGAVVAGGTGAAAGALQGAAVGAVVGGLFGYVYDKIAGPTTTTPPTQGSEPLPPPAPIQSNQTEEKKKNLADADRKGIPRDQLGPSGLPKVKVVKHSTEKRAKDAARNAGQGSPAKDASPPKGGPHYHPTNRDGSRKKGKQNVHHEYPG